VLQQILRLWFPAGKPVGITRALESLASAAKCPHAVTGGSPERIKEISMFLALFVIFLVFWLLGFLAFHIAGGFIHLLLVVAVISLVVHFLRR
jgi:hypothetical protein